MAVGVMVVVTSMPGKGDHVVTTAPFSIFQLSEARRTNTLRSMTKASMLSGAACSITSRLREAQKPNRVS